MNADAFLAWLGDTHGHLAAALFFARLPWPVRRLVGWLRLRIGWLFLTRGQREWVRHLEAEERPLDRND